MKLKVIILCVFTISIISCEDEAPETGCHLNSSYVLDEQSLSLSFIYDTVTQKEVKDPDLTANFIAQYNNWRDIIPVIFPYNKFFIDEISFPSDDSVRIHFKHDSISTFPFIRQECLITVDTPDMPLRLALRDSGERISESRYAIFEHDRTLTGKDTFLFLDFVIAPNVSITEVLKNFAQDHPGNFDTLGLQFVFNGIHD
ncbi:MAG TPA: hypothetical protein VFG10_06620 [Saprospiraceae bacterium]|nr:hypothetical protein [Saprospiraceae bacterium]